MRPRSSGIDPASRAHFAARPRGGGASGSLSSARSQGGRDGTLRRWAGIAAAAVAGLGASAVAPIAIGTLLWQRATARAVDRLGAAATRHGPAPSRFSREQLAGLPRPVAVYFEFALTPGQPLVRRARLRQAGEFRARAGSTWSPFTAVQHYSVRPPGFVWDASIRMTPLLPVRVRDSYLDGEGAMYAKLAALMTVTDQRDTREVAASSLLRYLAEAVWLPSALLPSEGVEWAAVDDTTARMTLTDGPTTVWLDVQFATGGEIVRVSGMRHRDVDGTPVLTPWVGHFHEYARVRGMMIPTAGEVEWVLTEGRRPYWRGRIIEAEYAFDP